MFIKTNNKEDLIKKIEENKDKEIIIHYNCENCDDEQVTYFMADDEIEDVINQIKKFNYILLSLECTNCGQIIKLLNPYYVQGIGTDL